MSYLRSARPLVLVGALAGVLLAHLPLGAQEDALGWCEGEAVVAPEADGAADPTEPAMPSGRLEGRVLDAVTGNGIGDADVRLPSAHLWTTTDAEGRFEMSDVPPGARGIEVRHDAYATQRSCLAVPTARSVLLVVALDPEPIPLEELSVMIEDVRPRWLEGTGFYHRMAAADGIFITRREIVEEDPSRLTELFRGRIGVSVRGEELIARHGPTTMVTGTCPIQYFVDGRRMRLPLGINTFQPGDVEAIEAYFGAPRLPAQFNVGRAACGAVVIWLRIR